MPLRSDWSTDNCPLARSLEVLGDPWTLLILREVFFGGGRFDEIKQRTGIADSVLSKRLSSLTEGGMLTRAPYVDHTGRTRDEYRLTEMGEGALPALNAMIHFAESYLEAPSGRAHMEVIHTTCGQPTTSADRCDRCRGPLTAATTSWVSYARTGEPVRLSTAVTG